MMALQPEELKTLRKAAGLTQDQLAAAIGMSRVSIGLMERGQAPIERRTELAVRYLFEHAEAAAK
ncbi:helix-turn-helix transcriptional regulator [Sphingomonas sp. DT-51]|uniref:helix-turn-helix transcriptional regulator n=1 Tax=Sphingomonas sp. DT-51 TaxID=3396165 RepID=UPI003F1A9282